MLPYVDPASITKSEKIRYEIETSNKALENSKKIISTVVSEKTVLQPVTVI